jgi:uncharacterized protein (DUF111 family)
MVGDLPSGWQETAGRMILAQIDHLSGEELGALVEELYRIGLPGVQLSPSLTKKNRLGQIGLIDLGNDHGLTQTALILASFGIYGFHVVDTRHVHLAPTSDRAKVTIWSAGKSVQTDVGIKRLALPDQPEVIRVEFDDLVMLSQQIKTDLKLTLAPSELGRRLGSSLASDNKAVLYLD